MIVPVLSDIREAHNRIRSFVHHTPVMKSELINDMAGCDLHFKCENFQKVGAFKFRGATNAIRNLTPQELERGVATHSSGNHAAALALAASMNNAKAFIVMPNNAPAVKKAAVKGYNAEITFCRPTLKAREETLKEIVKKTGATFIHPYDNFNVISGQGTAAIELLEEVSELDIIIAPVGGGGLLSGTAIAAKALRPGIKVIAAEPAKADDAYRSFRSGELQPSVNPQTVADGLLTSLSPLTFGIIRDNVDDIITVSEKSIIDSMLFIWERMKIIVEPSSAVVLAAVLSNKKFFEGKKIGLIISGGNIDFRRLPFTQKS